ncbi:serine hydrolase domain-containing protein [Rhodococcoides kroppenstedtii]|uniref:Beta-lactamase family protein n=1 Tax=Rhodococcoides kroppenstedtii TaxID=293050 RepID=A0ABS7NPP6_9NOCA|nr:serine hydrolase domain-containing protein [Rhodococcus kroppenstedtii]AMY18071.1 Esterase EstB [Rhodococcus sp. PBTS 1]MBY6313594.1 beta-lactamase family protein [Rhodococcus kroppenstedtii]MBY6319983.1 beta-lactamase family protein [Rhodococcus kroppenstedtii]MBY6398922.1 beta-lactamase family protein [Rhodococcus kroppenstedtii]
MRTSISPCVDSWVVFRVSGDSSVEGRCDAAFHDVAEALQANLASGAEVGASVVVDLDGETVVDLWGGHRDAERTAPWTEDTVVNVWSTTKTVTALATLMVIDRGLLDPFAPVARSWPEFAAAGKDRIEVRHILSHASGVSGWDRPIAVQDLYDHESAVAKLATQPPWWDSRTTSGYHAASQGHLLAELIRRVTGKTLREFVADEIAGPLGADFQIGLRPEDRDRVADVIAPPPPPRVDVPDPDKIRIRTFGGPVVAPDAANTDEWRAADMGALNGHGNARSVARMLSAISRGGEVDGVRLLSQGAVDLAFEPQTDGMDLVLGIPLRFGMGFALPHPETVPYIPDGRICFWGGWGGSMIVMHPESRLTFSYAMNKMGSGIIGSDRAEQYLRATYSALARTTTR